MVVRDDDDTRAVPVSHITEQFHDLSPANTVERGGRLIGENQAGLIGQGAGDGDTLLLARRRAGSAC
jgi:hypothetical protein